MVDKLYIPDRGDIIWLNFDPVKGHEQKGVRPAFVVSSKIYNSKTSLALVCPITSFTKGYSYEVELRFTKTQGVILADHVRNVDWSKRRARYVETISPLICEEVEQKLLTLIAV